MLSLSLKLLDAAAMGVAPSGRDENECFSLDYVFEDIFMPPHLDDSFQESPPVTQLSEVAKPLPKIPPKLPPKPPKPILPPKPKSLSLVSCTLNTFCTLNEVIWIEQTNEKYTAKRALIRIRIPNGTVNNGTTR